MQSCILKLSEMDLKDRLTVEHYISDNLELIQELSQARNDLVPLGKYALVRGGKRLPQKAQYSETGVPYIRVVDIGAFEVEMNNVVYISQELHKKVERYQLKYNDVAIVIVGATIGKVAIFKSRTSPCNFNENLARITVKDKQLNPDYLVTYLQSLYGQAYVYWLTGGSAQAKLSLERIKRIQVPLPPRDVQDRIAQVMQDAYATRQANLAEAESLLAGIDGYVLEQLGISLGESVDKKRFLVKASRFAGRRFDIGPYANEFDVEEATASSWVELQELAKLPRKSKVASRTPNNEFAYVGMPDVDDIMAEVNIQQLLGSEIKANKAVFKGGDIVFARIEPCIYNRKIAMIPKEAGEVLGSTELLVARAKQGVLPEFLLWILRSEFIQRQIAGRMTGTTGRRRLPNSTFTRLKIPKVPMELQKKLAEEAMRRRDQAKRLRAEAESVVAEAKAQVARMILGEG